MHRDIAESRRELEYEQAHTRQTFGRERYQQLTLDHLGLSEVEAVEYVLMLSRDEEEARRQQRAALLADAPYGHSSRDGCGLGIKTAPCTRLSLR